MPAHVIQEVFAITVGTELKMLNLLLLTNTFLDFGTCACMMHSLNRGLSLLKWCQPNV